jgi:hypothetical protein
VKGSEPLIPKNRFQFSIGSTFNIVRSKVISHCMEKSSADFKRSMAGRNPYCGFIGEARGGARRIACL